MGGVFRVPRAMTVGRRSEENKYSLMLKSSTFVAVPFLVKCYKNVARMHV